MNKLKSEIEYIGKKKNGKAKEYYHNGKLKFDGKYLDDKKWNGKIYNPKGKLEFKIIKGNGKAKEYNDDGKLIFEGEYLNGERNGKT